MTIKLTDRRVMNKLLRLKYSCKKIFDIKLLAKLTK